MARVLLTFMLAAALLLPAAADASPSRATPVHSSVTSGQHGQAAARRAALAKLAAREPVALATMLAARYWRAMPCGGHVAVRAEQPLATGLDSTTDGWATFESSLGPNDLDAPASTYTGCAISLARWQWPSRLEIVGDWNMFCLTVIHEMGHLLGHPHSPTPASVMAPVFTDESSVPAICRATRPRREAAAALSRLQ